jgi:long-chain acyl-CoA synthetase
MTSQPNPGTLEFWAEQKPDAIALVEGDRAFTYAEWNDRANRVAAGLRARGVGAGDIVVLRTQICAEWAIVASALAKLGCSLLALNWRLTPTETRYVLSNSGANVLICDDADPASLIAGLTDFPLKLAVSIAGISDGLVPYEALEAQAGPPLLSAADPPLIIYTSGTTGLPKGVVMSGRAAALTDQRVAEYLQDIAAQRRKAAGTAVLIALPMHHGAGPSALWGALREGVKVVMLRRFDAEATLRLIDQHRITAWTGVPTMFKRIATLPPDVLAKYDVSSLVSLSVGAAPVPHGLKLWIEDYFGKDKLAEGYGATEVGMITYTPPGTHVRKPGSSGLPHKHVDIRIRNEHGNDLPAGMVGEIWVRTPTTIKHYLNGQVLGADTLDADGFFRVGDVGHLDSDGYLFISDRAKDMIISGGVNIYPAEIEAALMTHEAVQDAAVIGIPDDEFGEQIKAFIEVKPGRLPTATDILAHARKTLASYKQPKSVEFVAELPRNTMGKILKRELRAPYWKERERKV